MKPANRGPIYAAALYPKLAEIARSHGYALAVHGSLARDFDLICVPWTDSPSEPEDVVLSITDHFDIHCVGDTKFLKNHGRLVWTLAVGFSDSFIDLSFMPRQMAP